MRAPLTRLLAATLSVTVLAMTLGVSSPVCTRDVMAPKASADAMSHTMASSTDAGCDHVGAGTTTDRPTPNSAPAQSSHSSGNSALACALAAHCLIAADVPATLVVAVAGPAMTTAIAFAATRPDAPQPAPDSPPPKA